MNKRIRVPSKIELERWASLGGRSSRQHVELARTPLPQQAVRLRPGASPDLARQGTPTKSRPVARQALRPSQTSTASNSAGP